MKTAIELFTECASIVNASFPTVKESERLTATISLVDFSIRVNIAAQAEAKANLEMLRPCK